MINNNMVTFFERLGAYLIDIIVVGFLLLIIGYGLPSGNTDEINKQMTELEEKYANSEITTDVYLKESYDLIYELQKSSKLSSLIGVAVTVAYFVIFQTMYNGQTFGKKLLKLRVVDAYSHKNISYLRMLLRSLLTLSIMSSCCSLVMLLILSKNAYIIGYLLTSGIEILFIITVIIMILYRSDKRGLHDLITKTCVIKEGGM